MLGFSIVNFGYIKGDIKGSFCFVVFLLIIELLLDLEFVVGRVNIVLIGNVLFIVWVLVRMF